MALTTSAGARHDIDQEPTADTRELPVGWIAAALLVSMVAAFLWVTRLRDGDFTYPLDDSYIHLRLGANLAHGTLGMNPGEFASASSSPIWPVLIAATTRALGHPFVGIPLALALVAACATLVLLDRWARRGGWSLAERAALMAAMVLVVPLLAISLTGMEHALQIGGVILLVALVVGRVDRADRGVVGSPDTTGRADAASDGWAPGGARRADLAILGAAALCAATRLEAVFVLVPLGVLVVAHRRWRTLGALALGAAAPVAIVAAVDLGQGWPALPASVLVKSSGVHRALGPAVLVLLQTRLLLVACLAVLCCWWGRRTLGAEWPRRATWWTAIAASATALNVGAGLIVQLYRYEAYLVALCIVAASVNVHALLTARRADPDSMPLPLALRGLAGALGLGALCFGLVTVPTMSNAVQEIHLQQVQMARFAATACPGCTVVLNDIGVVALHGDVRIVDKVGLANLDVLEATRAGTYDTRRLDEIARSEGATLAMVYPNWDPAPPDRWEPVGAWTVPDPDVLGGSQVFVYSLDPTRTTELRRAFLEFEMPPEVKVDPLP